MPPKAAFKVPALDTFNPARDLDMYHNLLLLGSSGCGKSTLMKYMLMQMTAGGRFWNVMAFCGNKEAMRDMETMVDKAFVYEGWQPERLKRVLAEGAKLLELTESGAPHRPILVILDDIAAADKKAVNSPLMKNIISQGRHEGVCVWVTSQVWNQTNNATRSQYSDIILCGTYTAAGVKHLNDDYGIGLDSDAHLKTVLRQYCANHGALVVRNRMAIKDPDNRFERMASYGIPREYVQRVIKQCFWTSDLALHAYSIKHRRAQQKTAVHAIKNALDNLPPAMRKGRLPPAGRAPPGQAAAGAGGGSSPDASGDGSDSEHEGSDGFPDV
jgi:energy-coupling factor transporter ATP-binding protein EcfA2